MAEYIARFQTFLFHLTHDEEGATAVEYGLLVALIAVVIIAGVTLLGSTLNSLFSGVAGKLPTVGGK